MSIAVLLSTRQRPESLSVAVQSIIDTSVLPDTHIAVGFDNDDLERPLLIDGRIFQFSMDRPDALGGKFNALWQSMPDYDYYIYACDDIAYRTFGWDRMIEDAGRVFSDGVGMISAAPYPEGMFSIPLMRAMTRKLVDLIGYFCPELFPFGADDAWQHEIAMFAQRIVSIPKIKLEMIGGRGKTRGLHEADFWGHYFDRLLPEREAIANRVIDAMDESDTRRALIRTTFPFLRDVFLRRRGLRDPEKARRYEELHGFDNTPDDRYMRLKAKALKFLSEQEKENAQTSGT